ncbi:MAG: Fic family protein [Burkholderiales bacterium]|jgi:Fic family protein|nr:Fic family protein [Burkholderiales bacterium]
MTLPETPSRIEPTLLGEAGGELLDLLAELPAAASALGSRLHPRTAASLADLVRVMNCYYSNLIEGHNTRPRDIERALGGDLDGDEERRNLQLEARQHIRLQREIDRDFAAGVLPEPASLAFVARLHREFYRDAPPAMLRIEGAGRKLTMEPGELRSRPEEDVAVGRHQPPSSARVADFMAYFEQRYAFARLSPAQRILAIPAAHHRFNYIHPFPDGNGRVSRLMSHAMALHSGIGAHGLWSISRGLARGLESRTEYKSMMDHADLPRQGDLDGRGNLSLRALTEFSTWFLKVCLDQVRFMGGMFDLAGLADRLKGYSAAEGWRGEAGVLLTEILHRGEIARGDAASITGLGERTARALLGALVDHGLLGSDTPKAPVSLRFPIKALDVLFPRLYPEA